MINISNLSFSYGRTNVFDDLTMVLEPGKIYGLLGENGVGKTTLLKIMCGLLTAQKGICTIDNQKPSHRTPEFLEEIYFLPEEISYPNIKISEYALNRGKFYPNYDNTLFLDYLKMFETNPSKKFNTLSFGQRKKAMIAFAFATRTKYLLMDEPSNGLDIPSKSQLRKIISLAASDNSCIIISTHQVRDLENIIDPIIILDKNAVLLNASIEEISNKLSFIFNESENKSALYHEQTVGGYLTVEVNKTGIEQNINIEALFNTVISNKKVINDLFKK